MPDILAGHRTRRVTRSRIFALAMMAIGAIAFAFVLRALDWDATGDAIRSIGPWFLAIAAIDLASVMCDASSIHAFLRVLGPASYARVFAAQASGIAINRLTPSNSLGEPTKLAMLVQDVPTESALSALVQFHLVNYFTGIAFLIVGVPVTLLLVDLPRDLTIGVWAGAAVLIALATGVAFLVRRGAAAIAVDVIARTGLLSEARRVRFRERAAVLDANIKNIRNRRAIASAIGSRLLNASGTVLLLYAAGFPMSGALIAASLSVGQLITWVAAMVPLGLGLSDGGNGALFRVLGLPTQLGLVYAMVSRLRTLLLSAMGLTVMMIANLIGTRGRGTRPAPT